MRAIEAYGNLLGIGRPVIETREAAARLGTSSNTATQLLRSTEQAGLIRRLRRGLWALDPAVDPLVVAPYLTVPYPAYASFWSALARHGMIEQIPATVDIATLDRTRRIETTIGTFSLHHLAPELFTGFDGSPELGYLAGPEKALFDTVYVRAPRGGGVYFPELTLADDFNRDKLDEWVSLIPRPRMATMVSRGLHVALAQADRYAADDY